MTRSSRKSSLRGAWLGRHIKGRIILCSAASVVAAQLFTSSARGDGGTWVGNNSGTWSDPNPWTAGIIADGVDSIADFSHVDINQDNTITLDTSRTLGSLNFGDTFTGSASGGNWILAGPGILTLADTTATPTISAGTMNLATNASIISVTIAGSQGLLKNGVGTLTLSGNNTFSGSLTISQGVVRATTATALGASNNVFLSGGTLDLRADASTNFGANLTATSDFSIDSDNLAGTGTPGSGTQTIGNITLVGARIFTNAGNSAPSSGTLNGGYALTTGVVSANNNETIINNSLSVLTLGGITSTATTASTITLNGTTGFAGNIVVSGPVTEGSAPLALSLVSARTLQLNGALAYTGGTNVTAGGTVLLGNNVALPNNGPVNITNGSIIYTGATPVNSTIGTLTLGGAGATGLATSTSTVTLGGDLVYIAGNANAATVSGNLNLGTVQHTFNIASTLAGASPEVLINSAITDPNGVGLSKTGAGQVRFSLPNTISGPFSVNAGTLSGLAFASGNAFTSGPVAMNGGALALVGQSSAGAGTVGALSIGSTGAPKLVVNATAGAVTTLNVSSFVGRSGALGTMTVIPAAGSLNSSEIITFGTAPTLTNTILPAYVATQVSAANTALDFLSLSGNNLVTATYNGGSDINAAAASSIFQTTSPQALTADRNVYALKSDGAAISGAATLTIGNGSGQAGLILDNGASVSTTKLNFGSAEGVVWAGGSAPGTISSPITLSNTLTTAGSQILNLNGAIDLNGARTIAVTGTGTTVVNSLISDGTLTKDGSGILALAIDQTSLTNPTTISGGTLQVGNGAAAGTAGSGPIITNANLAFNRTDGYSPTNPISGTGNVIQAGTGTLTLSGPLTYSGVATVQAGTMKTTASSLLPSNSGLAIQSGATFDMNGLSQTIGTLSSGATGGVLTSSVAGNLILTVGNGSNSTYSGILNNGVSVLSLVKNGSGTLTLNPGTPSSTFTGGTTINGGMIYLGSLTTGNTNALGSGTVTLNGGTLALSTAFGISGNGVTFSNRIVIPAGGNGTLQGGLRGTAGGIIQRASDSVLNVVVAPELQYQVTNGASNNPMEFGNGSAWSTATFAGQINVLAPNGAGNFRFNQSGANTNVYPAMNLNDGVTAYAGPNPPNGGTTQSTTDIYIGALNGTSGSFFGGSSVPGRHVTYHVGSLNTNSTFNGTIQNSLNAQGFVGGGDMSLEKVGTGRWTLNGPVTYSSLATPAGFATVSGGTLQIGSLGNMSGVATLTTVSGATFEVVSGGKFTANARVVNNGNFSVPDGFATNPGMTLTGTGTVHAGGGTGTYVHNTGTINAGALGTAGILNFDGNLSLAGGTVGVDLASPSVLAGSNDEILVGGNLNISATPGILRANFLGSPPVVGSPAPLYPFLQYTGSATGLANLSAFNVAANIRGSFSLVPDPTLAKTIDLQVNSIAGGAGNLTWTGATNATWDLNQTVNWKIGTTPSTYFDGDNVAFLSDGKNNGVTITSTLIPGSMLFDSAFDYSISGAGTINGAGVLTKNNTNTVTINTANGYTGGTIINGGTLALNTATAAGTGTITLNNGGTLKPLANLVGNTLTVNASNTGTLFFPADNNASFSGAITGAGTLITTTLHSLANGNANLINLTTNLDLFTGTIDMSTVTTPTAMRLVPTGSINTTATFNVGNLGATLFNRSGGTYTIGMINGGTNSFLAGNQAAGTAASTYVVGGNNGNGTFNGAIINSNNPVAIIKAGTGTWMLGNPTSSYTGATTVNAGTLDLNGAGLTSATFTVNSGGTLTIDNFGASFNSTAPAITLAGTGALNVASQFNYQVPSNMTISGTGGTIYGEINLGAGTISPGTTAPLTVGTVNFHDQFHVGGGTISMDLNTNTTAGSGTNDLITVGSAGTLDLQGGLIIANFLTAPANGSDYTLMQYTAGQETGNISNLTLSTRAQAHLVDTGSAIMLHVDSFAGAALTWRSQQGNVWDVGITPNWINATGAADKFFQLDSLTFDDQPGVNTSVQINSYAVAPTAINVNSNTNQFSFNGTGTISGAASLTKNGTSTLTINNNNNYTGGTTINAGTIAVTTPQPFTGTATLNNGAAIAVIQPVLNTTLNYNGATFNVPAAATGTMSLIANNNFASTALGSNGAQLYQLSVSAGGTLNGGGTLDVITSNVATGPGTLLAGALTAVEPSDINMNANAFTGTINLINSGQYPAAGGSLALGTELRLGSGLSGGSIYFNLGNVGTIATNSASTMIMGALTGGPSVVLKGFEGVSGANAGGAVTYSVGSLNLDSTFAGAILDGAGTTASPVTLSKFGTAKLTLSGTNTFTGSVIVNAGTLALTTTGSVNNVGTISVLNGATFDAAATGYTGTARNINGSGSILGNVTLTNSTMTPGAIATVGTLSLANNLSISTQTFNTDIASVGVIGSGTNDLVDVAGQLSLTGTSTIVPGFLTAPVVGKYPVIRYGTKTGTGTIALGALTFRGTASVDFSQANLVNISIATLTPASLSWRGAGNNGGIWDVNTTPNWVLSAANGNFFQLDTVSFLETASAPTAVVLNTTVLPGNVIVSSSGTFNYTISGTGKISGPGSLTKSGTSTLTIQTTNDYLGGSTINAGTINVGSLGSSALGSGSIVLNGGNIFATGTSTVTFATRINANAATTSTLSLNGTGAVTALNGNLTGTGTIQLVSDSTTKLYDLNGSNTTFGGAVVVNGTQTIRFGSTGGSATALWSLPAGGTISTNAGTSSNVTSIPLGALSGSATSTLKGYNAGGTGGATEYQLGGASQNGIFAGNVIDGASGTTVRPLTITKVGNNQQTLSGSNSYTGGTNVNAGTLALVGINSWTPALTGATPTILNGGRLVFDYSTNTPDNPAAAIKTILTNEAANTALAFNAGQLHTSLPADPRHGIGWIDNNSTAVNVGYTYFGDANVDGKVDTSDFMALAQHFGMTSAIWSQGDFNYDGVVNALDFNYIATNFGAAPIPAPPALGTPVLGSLVPEPTSFGLLALAATALASRRRRR